MLKSIFKQIHDVEHFLAALGDVLISEVEDGGLAPFVELFDAV